MMVNRRRLALSSLHTHTHTHTVCIINNRETFDDVQVCVWGGGCIYSRRIAYLIAAHYIIYFKNIIKH